MPRPTRTFAQIEQQLEEMSPCSTKYRLLAALYDGLLTDGMAPDSPEKPPRDFDAEARTGYRRGRDGYAVKVR